MLYGYALEPGDLFRLNGVASDFDTGEVFKVINSSHGANYINEITGEAILKCSLTFDDNDQYFSDVLLLLHAESGPPITRPAMPRRSSWRAMHLSTRRSPNTGTARSGSTAP